MRLRASSLIVVPVLLAGIALAGDETPTPEEEHFLRQVLARLHQLNPEEVSADWPYRLGSPPACRTVFRSLAIPASPPVVDGDSIVTESPNFEGTWLFADLDRRLVWIVRTMDYFGAYHYFGPARMDDDSGFAVAGESTSDPVCETEAEAGA